MKEGYWFDSERHIHYLGQIPLDGTTTALSVLSKPLCYWASGLAVETLGWSNVKKVSSSDRLSKAQEALNSVKKMEVGEYLGLLDKAYKAHATSLTKSADKGVDLHSSVEAYIKGEMGLAEKPKTVDDRILPFILWCQSEVKRFLWCEAHCYSKSLWVGGISDFGYEDIHGKFVLADIKSSKEAYFSHYLQAGGYDLQIAENGCLDSKGEIIYKLERPISYYAIFPFGKPFKEPSIVTDTYMYQSGFTHAVKLYKVQKKFNEYMGVE